MKIIDKLKYSWHNIKQNKARSILSAIIVYILSTLIMGILFVGISFSRNMNRSYKELLKQDDVYISLRFEDEVNTEELTNKFLSIISKHKKSIDFVTSYQYPFGYLYDFSTLTKPDFTLKYTSVKDLKSDSNSIILDSSLEGEYKINDIYRIQNHDFIVTDFYESSDDLNGHNIVDLTYCNELFELKLTSLSITYTYKDGNFNDDLKSLNKLYKKLNSSNLDKEKVYIDSYSLHTYNKARSRSTIIIGVVSFVAILLLLLSIGTISNSIMVSIDQNRHFLGMIKAMGLNKNGVFTIVLFEVIITILGSIVVSSITISCFAPMFENLIVHLLNLIIGDVYEDVFKSFKVIVSLPWYLPIISTVFFVAFTILFSKNSLKKLLSNSPIEVLNEGDGNEA